MTSTVRVMFLVSNNVSPLQVRTKTNISYVDVVDVVDVVVVVVAAVLTALIEQWGAIFLKSPWGDPEFNESLKGSKVLRHIMYPLVNIQNAIENCYL